MKLEQSKVNPLYYHIEGKTGVRVRIYVHAYHAKVRKDIEKDIVRSVNTVHELRKRNEII
jgi:hypothetical protein